MQNVFDTGNQNVSKLDQCYLLQTTNNFCEGTAAKRKIYINVNRLYKCSTPRNGETLKQFVGNLLTNCLSVFDHFVGLALKGLKPQKSKMQLSGICVLLQSFGLIKFLRLL